MATKTFYCTDIDRNKDINANVIYIASYSSILNSQSITKYTD